MKVDLHCHSHYSDGKHSPSVLIQLASQNRVTHLAITDHDCTAAISEARPLASSIILINGVEISCDWRGLEAHIVGLLFDPSDHRFIELLSTQQQKRELRMRAIAHRLESLGHEGLMAYLHELPCIDFTRSHAADYLVTRGICKNRQKAFKSHLGKRGQIYVAADWCSLTEAVTAI